MVCEKKKKIQNILSRSQAEKMPHYVSINKSTPGSVKNKWYSIEISEKYEKSDCLQNTSAV